MAHRPWKIVGLQLSGARTGKFHSVFFPLSVSLGSNPQEGFGCWGMWILAEFLFKSVVHSLVWCSLLSPGELPDSTKAGRPRLSLVQDLNFLTPALLFGGVWALPAHGYLVRSHFLKIRNRG